MTDLPAPRRNDCDCDAGRPRPQAAPASRSRIGSELVAVVALKLLALALIYALFFGPSHRAPLDPAGRIADATLLHTTTR